MRNAFQHLSIHISNFSSAISHFGHCPFGGLAQLARAPALQAGGQRFESVILHDPDLGMMRVGNHNYQLLIANYSLGKSSLTY